MIELRVFVKGHTDPLPPVQIGEEMEKLVKNHMNAPADTVRFLEYRIDETGQTFLVPLENIQFILFTEVRDKDLKPGPKAKRVKR